MRVGVFALQGDVKEHINIIRLLNHQPVEVRNPKDLKDIDGFIVPGGESTTFWKLASRVGLDKPIINLGKTGFPIFGICAGLIMMAHEIEGYPNQPTWDIMDITVKRNAYGRQLDSHVESIDVLGIGKTLVAFIRAPIITMIGQGIEVLAKDIHGNIVFVRQGNLFGAAFHPETTGDVKIHKFFCDTIRRI